MSNAGFPARRGARAPHWEGRTLLDVREVALPPGATVREAARRIDEARCPMVLIVGEAGDLVGTVTDADLRRALLHGASLEAPVSSILGRERGAPGSSILAREPGASASSLPDREPGAVSGADGARPVLDERGRVVGLEVLAPAAGVSAAGRWVVMMAGGEGKRLHPLTESCPKSLLAVGGRPLLEITLESLRSFGFEQFYFAVHHKAAMIEEHFRDGSRFGVRIEYIREEKPLGTAGALGLLPHRPAEAFLMMNADLLTTVDCARLLDFHERQGCDATLCVYGYDLQVPYGVVELDGERMNGIREQPVQRLLVNAGIYVLEPSVLELVPYNQPFAMPELIEALIARQRPTAAFPIREYWRDVGRISDLERANAEYPALFRTEVRRATAAG